MSEPGKDPRFGTQARPDAPAAHTPEPPPRGTRVGADTRARSRIRQAADADRALSPVPGASQPPGGPPGSPGRNPWPWRLGVLVVALVLFAGGFLIANQVHGGNYEGDGNGSVTVVVHPGDTGRQIATTLVGADVIAAEGPFEKALRDNPGREIQPGTYTLKKQMSAEAALELLRDDQSRQVIKVTIPEGKRATEVYDLLAQASGLPVEDYQAAAANPAALGLPGYAGGRLEGYLFPATYTFDPGTTPRAQLTAMVTKTREELDSLDVPTGQRQRIVILASMIEMEARQAPDRPKVARVIENRLAQGMPLQLDSTVKYPYPPDGKVTTTDEQRAAKNGYNTYVIRGLPVGPIANPGRASMEAALHPAQGDWLFFVTVDSHTGLTRFATTMAEHSENVAEFRAWCQANPGNC